MSTLNDVLQLWLNNLEFRAKFKTSPHEALMSENIELDPADLKKIQSYIARKEAEEGDSGHGTDAELGKRISK